MSFFNNLHNAALYYSRDGEPLLYGGSKNDSFLKLMLSGQWWIFQFRDLRQEFSKIDVV